MCLIGRVPTFWVLSLKMVQHLEHGSNLFREETYGRNLIVPSSLSPRAGSANP